MTIYTPWGDADQAIELLEGVLTVQTPTHGGLMFTPAAAEKFLSKHAIAEGWLECGHYCYEEDVSATIPLLDSESVLQAARAKGGYFKGWSDEKIKAALIDALSGYSPRYLIATGIEPNKEIYQTYLWRIEAEKLRKDNHPELVVAASGEWRTFIDGVIEVSTADGKRHFVTDESYGRRNHDTRIGYMPMLTDFEVVEAASLPPLEERLIPFAKSRLAKFKANYRGDPGDAETSWQRISDAICMDLARLLAESPGSAYGEADLLREKVARAGITYTA